MKKFLLFACMVFSIGAFAQDKTVVFKDVKHSFGKIKQNVPATYTFAFTNNGTKPAIIEVATAECGCTTPEYTKAPIPKGQSSKIKVTYNAANMGTFTKRVTVKFANIPEPVILTIEGEVVPAAAKTK
ncbi:MAG: DUF1573 domain-containing protein [Chitinophagaceae bacterium]|nr:DUF1573 domain-containing protein [Chitinophagaceae bacterium]